MSFANVSVPNNLVSTVSQLAELAQAEPVVAEHIIPIVQEAFTFAMRSGRVTDPDVWVRAFKAAAAYVETRAADGQFLAMTPIRG